MPWCDDCSKFWNPNSMPPDGSCPKCGRSIADPPDTKVPWHFWLLVVALTIYLGWRLVQGIAWLVDNDRTLWAVGIVAAAAALAAWAFTWWRSDHGETADPADPGDAADAGDS